MKKIYFLFIPLSVMLVPARAQEAELSKGHIDTLKILISKTLNEKIRLDFAVPDIPAFKAIGADPSQILRPSSPKDFAIMFGNFINGNGNGVIPQNFSAEIAPGLIVKPWYTLNDYQKNGGVRFLTKSRFSVATTKDDKTGVNSMAIGFRTTLYDNGDFRLNKAATATVFDKQDELTKLLVKSRNDYIRKNNLTIEQYQNLSKEERMKIFDTVAINQFNDDVESVIKQYKKDNWNATRLDLAYSLLLQSPDSLLGNAKISKHLFWLTCAIKPGANNKWGQLLLGFNTNIYNYNSKAYNSLTGNLRFYFGTNKIKGFLEGQYKNADDPKAGKTETLYSSIGLEVSFFNGIWIHFGTGVENVLKGNSRSQLLSNINLNLTFPEHFKLF